MIIFLIGETGVNEFQAALGPLALDIARESGTPEQQLYASHILIVAVLAILLTAPAGAIIITLLGPRLLTRVVPVEQDTGNSDPKPDSHSVVSE